MHSGITLLSLEARAYRIPTDGPESDGTLTWDHTDLVVVEAAAGGQTGWGYTYAHASAAGLIRDLFVDLLKGGDALSPGHAFGRMQEAVRNIGRPGLAGEAISAVDAALWDLKARLLGMPLASLLGRVRDSVPLYGSGGFTNYPEERLRAQLEGWVSQGMRFVKMKIGSRPELDPERVRAARQAVGPDAELFVDANGALSPKQALLLAVAFSEQGVSWFEEPVSSDNLDGMRLIREKAPPGMDITSGEYGYHTWYFLRMLRERAVDVLQPDATRCGGFSGFLQAAALCEAFNVPFSAHTAPTLHLPLGCALGRMRHIEFFYDHARIEGRYFDGFAAPENGAMRPDAGRPGLGVELKKRDLEQFAL